MMSNAVKTPVPILHAVVIHAPWSAEPGLLTDAIRKIRMPGLGLLDIK